MSDRAPTLVADVGGTHSRFGLLKPGTVQADAVMIFDNDAYHSLSAVVTAYLADTGAEPDRAVIAIAGPIEGPQVRFTNRDWAFETGAFARKHGFARLSVVNDFQALARALPHFQPDALHPIGPAAPCAGAPKVVLGPGTGLGVAAALRCDGRWLAVPGEGGHVELAATTEREEAVYRAIRRELGRVSAEAVVSGPGLGRLDAALAALAGTAHAARDGAAIAEAARNGEPRACEAMALFFAALARFAGDVALTFLATGGVYLYGGVIQKVVDLLDPVAFRRGFADKAPYGALLEGVATTLILSETAGLLGCAAIAAEDRRP
jgi:glucokinase